MPLENEIRLPPHNLDIEKSLLCGLIFQKDNEILDLIKPEHFYRTAHQTIFTACRDLWKAKKTLELPLIVSQLGEKISTIGGVAYFSAISDAFPPLNTDSYCQTLVNTWKLRRLIELSNAIQKRAFCALPDEIDTVATYATSELQSIDGNRSSDWTRLDSVLTECIDLSETLQKKNGISGIPSGFSDLDTYTAGFQPGDLILLAARPGCGKTSFAINSAKNSARRGIKTGFMSLEMVRTQIGNRFLSIAGRINGLKFRSGKFCPEDWQKMTDAASNLSSLPIWIDDSARSNPSDIARKARSLKQKDGLDILWIDYLGFLDGDKSQRSKVYEIESITRSLKALAKELKIPVVLICQLNRALEQRPDKRPVLSDLRDSGALEQDADLVIFLYNDAKYNKNSTDMGIIECEIAKQRNGPCARIRLRWEETYTRFDNLERSL